jgi:hypothetical protein
MKVVINACYGGFSLSDAGVQKYAELKGLELYPTWDKYRFPTYWTVPETNADRIRAEQIQEDWHQHSDEEKKWSNQFYEDNTVECRRIPRNDEYLVKTVELLGADANGDCAKLKIANVPDDVKWEIDEYDGYEHVAEVHRTWS